jgi:hypothetical protein
MKSYSSVSLLNYFIHARPNPGRETFAFYRIAGKVQQADNEYAKNTLAE